MRKVKRRSAWIMGIVLCGFALVGCPHVESGGKNGLKDFPWPARTTDRPEAVVGFYKLDDPAQYGAKTMQVVPVGQVRYLGIDEERWLLRDMMVGFSGTWAKTPSGAILKTKMGPSGPVKAQEAIEVIRTETGLTLRTLKGTSPDQTFTFVDKHVPADFGLDQPEGSESKRPEQTWGRD